MTTAIFVILFFVFAVYWDGTLIDMVKDRRKQRRISEPPYVSRQLYAHRKAMDAMRAIEADIAQRSMIGTEGVINGRPWRRDNEGIPIYGYQPRIDPNCSHPVFHFGDSVLILSGIYEGLEGTIAGEHFGDYMIRIPIEGKATEFQHLPKKHLRLKAEPPHSHSVICRCEQCMKTGMLWDMTLNQWLLHRDEERVPGGSRLSLSGGSVPIDASSPLDAYLKLTDANPIAQETTANPQNDAPDGMVIECEVDYE